MIVISASVVVATETPSINPLAWKLAFRGIKTGTACGACRSNSLRGLRNQWRDQFVRKIGAPSP